MEIIWSAILVIGRYDKYIGREYEYGTHVVFLEVGVKDGHSSQYEKMPTSCVVVIYRQ